MTPQNLRRLAETVPEKAFFDLLKTNRKLRIKFGVDPTRPDIHLGHVVLFQVLRELQDMGHTVIFLIGDATTRIGDPSGRNALRPVLSDAEIKANVQTFLDQVGKVMDLKKLEIRYNSEWLDGLNFANTLTLMGKFTVAQLIEREDFANRLEQGHDLGLHELFYPVMQAYDSVALNADVEFGGTDQRFNLLAGRDLQKKSGQVPQQVVLGKLLVGLDGEKKMSKSADNYIGINDVPLDMYGKVMSIHDKLIPQYYELCTDIEDGVIEALKHDIVRGANPRDTKASLAREIVRIYHGDDASLEAEAQWNQTFRDKNGPGEEQINYIKFADKPLIDLLVENNLVKSRSDVRRLIEQSGIRIDGQPVEDETVVASKDALITIGKRQFIKFQ